MTTKPTLATASAAEIAAALDMPGAPTRCQYCGTVFTPRTKWQTFCSTKHRNAWHTEGKDRVIEKMQGIISAQQRTISELQAELAKSTQGKLAGDSGGV